MSQRGSEFGSSIKATLRPQAAIHPPHSAPLLLSLTTTSTSTLHTYKPQSLCNTLAQPLQYIRAASTTHSCSLYKPQKSRKRHTYTRPLKATQSYSKHTYTHLATQSAHTHHGYRSLPPLKHATAGTTLCARPYHARRSHGFSSSSSPSKRYLKQPLQKPPS